MRCDFSEGWLTVVLGVLVVVAAGPVVFSTIMVNGPSPAWAADENISTPPKPVVKEAETNVEKEKTSGEEETGEEIIGEEETGEEETGEEKTGEEETGEVSVGEKAVGETTTDEKAADETTTGEKSKGEKDLVGNTAVEKNGDNKNVDEKNDLGIVDDETNDSERKVVEQDAMDTGPTSPESFLVWLYHSLGTRYIIIFLIITFNAVALIVMIVLELRWSVICPEELVVQFETKLNEKKYQEAYELCKNSKSFLGKVLTSGMSRLPDGFQAAQDAMENTGEGLGLKMSQRNGYIALIAQIGPMFGLLGTVDGMVMAFDVIAHSNVTPKPSELAQGIGTALVTTVVGLWIAIPTLIFYNIVRNRTLRLLGEVSTISTGLMRRFAAIKIPVAKKDSES